MDPIQNVPNVTNTNPSIFTIYVNGTGIPFIGNQTLNNREIANQQVGVRNIGVGDTRVWLNEPPQAVPMTVPVTQIVGTPIVNIPGCVKVHKENAKKDPSQNKMLVNDDPKGNTTLCDAGMPYYEPPDYDYRELTWQTVYQEQPEAEGIDTGEPPSPDITTPEAPVTPPQTAEKVECPPPNARRVGDLNQEGTERITGYELSVDGKICITQWEDVPVVQRYVPSVATVSTTATIAAVATTSALLAKPLADLLLKVVKPVVKKAIAKVQKMLGKSPRRPSLMERKTDQYREKKGLLPMKKK